MQYNESTLSLIYNYILSSSLFYLFFFPSRLPAGAWLLHYELLYVHLLGSVLRLPGRLPGQGVCSVRLWLRDS